MMKKALIIIVIALVSGLVGALLVRGKGAED